MTPDLSKLSDAAIVQEVLFACVGDRGPIAQEVERRLASRSPTPPPAPSAVDNDYHKAVLDMVNSAKEAIGRLQRGEGALGTIDRFWKAYERWGVLSVHATPSPAPPAPAGGPLRQKLSAWCQTTNERHPESGRAVQPDRMCAPGRVPVHLAWPRRTGDLRRARAPTVRGRKRDGDVPPVDSAGAAEARGARPRPRRARWRPEAMKITRGRCWYCHGMIPLRKDGTLRKHKTSPDLIGIRARFVACPGSGEEPRTRGTP